MKKKPLFVSLALLLAGIGQANAVTPSQLSTSQPSRASVADAKRIQGVVLDAAGVPIIGANVIVEGTTIGSITDMDGHFTIEGVEEGPS